MNSMVASPPHTHRKYDDQQRIVLEIFEDDALKVVDYYQYEHNWIIREQWYEEKNGLVKFRSVERYREDGSAWTQKFFSDGTNLTSESRQIDTASGAIWHNIDYNPDGTISRSIHTTTKFPEGIVEQTVKDGRIEEYTLIQCREAET